MKRTGGRSYDERRPRYERVLADPLGPEWDDAYRRALDAARELGHRLQLHVAAARLASTFGQPVELVEARLRADLEELGG